MSELRKAAEMALEALERVDRWLALLYGSELTPPEQEVVKALRQALAQPKWVGLTQEEVDALLWKLSLGAVDEDVRLIEAKLKEKNGGYETK